MRGLRTILTVLLAVAWVPLTVHCQLESITGCQVLRCQSLGAGAPAGGSHCDDKSCCGWESGLYQLPQGQPVVMAAMFAVAPVVLAAAASLPGEVAAGLLTATCPGPPKPWQFCLRTALPARAPSIAP